MIFENAGLEEIILGNPNSIMIIHCMSPAKLQKLNHTFLKHHRSHNKNVETHTG
jgi:hypothetical protein